MNPSQRSLLLAAAREAVRARLTDTHLGIPQISDETLRESHGAFVSVHVAGELRGCVGVVEAGVPLVDIVTRCAVAAATEDSRFPPLTVEELEAARLEISVLSAPRSLPDPDLLEPGVHGVIVSDGARRALLLPQVATQHGFGRAQFLDAACSKAGLATGSWRSGGLSLEVFTAEVFAE